MLKLYTIITLSLVKLVSTCKYIYLQVASNGFLSLNATRAADSFTPEKFPVDDPLIAPFWADVDTELGGNVFYRSTTNMSLLNEAERIINNAFTGANFVPEDLYIVTWFKVDYYHRSRTSDGTKVH